MDSLRAALRVREETDVFYIVYSGSSQKYSGRWLCIDGFVDLNDLMKIWTVSLARAPENGGFPAKGTRLVLVRSLHHHHEVCTRTHTHTHTHTQIHSKFWLIEWIPVLIACMLTDHRQPCQRNVGEAI
jgi:hypothetical protein